MESEFRVESLLEQRKRLGLLTAVEAAKTLGLHIERFRWYVKTSQIIAPSAQIVGRPRKYYTQADISVLKTFFDSKNAA